MKVITIKNTIQTEDETDINKVSTILDNNEKHILDCVPWIDFSYKPEVSFSMLYSNSNILIKYFVEEKEIRAVENEINGKVWEDSCVEFFISLNNSKNYYNFEFNCIGTTLIGFGDSKTNRILLPDETVKQITTKSMIQNFANGYRWELTLKIPVSVFIYDEIDLSPGLECKANFYKCGDCHKAPHFITWNNIESKQPNFHLPDYFGKLNFQ